MYIRSVLYIFLFITGIYLIECTIQPEVSIEQGILRGFHIKTVNERQVVAFEGIPYAKPPSGKHRFKDPVPASAWLGVYNATREPPLCLQYEAMLGKTLLGSEDCLYINVYTPKLPDAKSANPELLDVLAFIHGGGFAVGKSWDHKPSSLLQKDVILVTFNYRLGPLGFISTGDSVVPGNMGLKDQLLALKWIQKNIAAFGGNPNSLTLGGISAGGASCHFHLVSPLSKGLFHRAICMSGVSTSSWAMEENIKEKTELIATDLGCPTNDSLSMINCLRNRPGEHIVSPITTTTNMGDLAALVNFAPVIEPPSATAFISESPLKIIKEKRGSDVPVILSYTLDEGIIGAIDILTKPDLYGELMNRWDELLPRLMFYQNTAPPEKMVEIGQKIRKHYKIDDTPEGLKNFIKMNGDRLFVASISKIAKLSASVYTSPVYVYRFSYRGAHSITEFFQIKEDLGVCHADDIIYTLGIINSNLEGNESDLEMSKQMLEAFVLFMKTGSLGENWEPVNRHLPKIAFTDIKGPGDFRVVTADELGEEAFWDSLGLNENLELTADKHDEF